MFTPVESIQVVDGEQGFVAPTDFLGQRVCQPGGIEVDWHAYARVEGHACGGPFTWPLSPDPVVFVLEDCDHDGVLAGEDCNDLDAGQNPTAIEVCDDLDNDCDGDVLDQAATVNHSSAPPVTYPDLQRAIDAATAEDGIVVCSGTYQGPFEESGPA